jgi:CBS domain-containing protein
MTRTDVHLDTMLRHLGAAYYESLHGRASWADVTRALRAVEEQLNEREAGSSSDRSGRARHSIPKPRADSEDHLVRQLHGWSRRVSDVMTTPVITVDRITPYKEIARLLADHRVSGMPVLKMGREVVGVVTEDDLLTAQASMARQLRVAAKRSWRPRKQQYPVLTAGEIMTTPAITVGPHVTVHAAARLMNTHHVRRLPVVDDRGRLMGIVSRRDLLSVFLRRDEEIAADIRQVLDQILSVEPGEVEVTVRNGVVTLTGMLDRKTGPHGDLIPLAIRIMWDVDGVVGVVDRLGEARTAGQA